MNEKIETRESKLNNIEEIMCRIVAYTDNFDKDMLEKAMKIVDEALAKIVYRWWRLYE